MNKHLITIVNKLIEHNKRKDITQLMDDMKILATELNKFEATQFQENFQYNFLKLKQQINNFSNMGAVIFSFETHQIIDIWLNKLLDGLTNHMIVGKALSTTSRSIQNAKSSKVFIVHGHDELAKTEVARFVEKLGFEAIILHEQVNAGQTIIEKIEQYSNVGYGIIIYTPCDSGSKKGEENNLKPRARQNVVFEHGYLIGKLDRNHVCALVKDYVETPSDISGIVYIEMDPSKAWLLKVANELDAAGYDVDLNKLLLSR